MKTVATVHRLVAFGIGAAVCGAASTIGTAQTSPARTPETIVVIGCVTQPTGRENAAGDPKLSRLEITDTRSNPPRRFIVQGSQEDLAWHVGHTLEVHGRIASGEAGGAAAGRDAQLPVITVQQIVYLQPTCVGQPK
ncbi:MAG TPA: hypothetical protein VFB07_13110 [Vicinamibacterales bacterium]|nr:hypothetical protein [Vicinamibacterales bacterium]